MVETVSSRQIPFLHFYTVVSSGKNSLVPWLNESTDFAPNEHWCSKTYYKKYKEMKWLTPFKVSNKGLTFQIQEYTFITDKLM